MSVNSTSSFLVDYSYCTVNSYVYTAFDVVRVILLLTLSTLVLYLGFHQWRKQRSSSHSDVFTYHMVAMGLVWVLGCFFYFCGKYTNHSVTQTVGSVASIFAYYGELCFHVLTCVERYLAVVHPITYLGLRNARGVKIRNISVSCVWLLCFGLIGVTDVFLSLYKTITLICFLIFPVVIISFCSLSVLCVLIRPGPGEGDAKKEQIDQSKLRAFHTMTAITCAVWLWFAAVLVSNALRESPVLSSSVKCLVFMCAIWCNLPSCLVLPLLFLHRAGKLSCCCYNNK